MGLMNAHPERSSRQLRFAIIGCGVIGNKRLKALRGESVIAACDVEWHRAADLAANAGPTCIPTTTSATVLTSDADAVIISTANAALAPLAAACIRHGKHVLVEKPVGISVAEIDELLTLADHNRVLVRAGYNHRYHPAMQKARQIFESGALGELMFIRARYGHGGRRGYEREWRADPSLSGGGELIDQGVHLIDLARWFLGPWKYIDGHATTYFWQMPVDDNAFLNLRNAAGNTAWLHVSCTEWKNLFSFEIYGKTGKLHIEGLGGSYGTERLYCYQMLPEMGPPDTIIYEYPRGDDSWALETAEFVEDIVENRAPAPGLREARETLAVVEEVYRKSGALAGGVPEALS
ncbi:MAG: Gfo/Idh/MocA family oxidoreductase [Acidobacteriaceae bacterium]|nr:Gfo/Idh/MocA family oxidoreductase [Acidobacteriaceae bacterium]